MFLKIKSFIYFNKSQTFRFKNALCRAANASQGCGRLVQSLFVCNCIYLSYLQFKEILMILLVEWMRSVKISLGSALDLSH